MYIEITEKLPTRLKLLLPYRGGVTIFIFSTTFILLILNILQMYRNGYVEYKRLKETESTKAIIVDIFETGLHKEYYGKVKPIMGYSYDYKIDNEEHRWTSYSHKDDFKLKVGDSIEIEYNATSPTYSVIKDFETTPTGSSIISNIFLNYIMITILLFQIRKGYKTNKILTNGIIRTSEIVNISETDSYHDPKNKYNIIKMIYYLYEDNTGIKTINKTYKKPHNLDVGNEQLIIFNKKRPELAIVIEDLAKPVKNYIKQYWIK